MDLATADKFPCSVLVTELISSRYSSATRPQSWDLRLAGTDVVCASDGRKFKLRSEGGQSPPQPGWEIVLRSGDPVSGYAWTLYRLPSIP